VKLSRLRLKSGILKPTSPIWKCTYPPSLRHGQQFAKKIRIRTNKGKPGQKIGHKGITRPHATPDRQVEVTMDRCPDCGAELVLLFESIPDRWGNPRTSADHCHWYKISHYRCPCCRKKLLQGISSCPHEGKFGNNVIALRRYSIMRRGCLTEISKTQCGRHYGLKISPATIFDLPRRAADAVRSEYDAILSKIRGAPIVYADETSIRVQGVRHWIWYLLHRLRLFRRFERAEHEGSAGSLTRRSRE